MSPETYENDVFQNKTKLHTRKIEFNIHTTIKQQKRNLEATLNC